MTTYIALLRGINVGKTKRIRMEPLRELVTDLGFTNVRTLVNSGNVVLTGEGDSDDIARHIEAALRHHHNLEVAVVVRTAAEMQEVVAGNPFPEIAATPKLLHVSFLAAPHSPDDLARLESLDTGDDRIVAIGKQVYLHVPYGLSGASPAIQNADRHFTGIATSRNWNTVTRLAEMAAGS